MGCRVSRFDAPAIRSGPLQTPSTRVHGSFNVTEMFEVQAEFVNDALHRCADCEFRQYVRGSMAYKPPGRANWITMRHFCGSRLLDPRHFIEDVGTSLTGQAFSYGYRRDTTAPDRYTAPDRPVGCIYGMRDEPGLGFLPPGTGYDVDLEYRGEIVDATGTVVESRLWQVRLRGTV